MKAEFSIAESGFQIGDELGAEQTAEHFNRKKKLSPTRDPLVLVRSDSAAGNNAMQVRMMMEVLPPSMQHRQKPDPGTKVPAVGGNSQQRFGGSPKEKALNNPLVPQRQRRDQMGHREDHMEVLDRQ